jgi:NAD(P)-dependent dehydrogenase (short-subunit alcohol dehydrogenase family)
LTALPAIQQMKQQKGITMKKLNGKWALVTGSSRGIGRQIAVALAAQGCNVIVHGRCMDHAAATLEAVKNEGVQGHAVAGELDSESQVQALINRVRDLSVPVDILYNNAAINNVSTPMLEFSQVEWLRTFQVNLFAMVQLCNAFAPAMRERQWGRIVNMTSGIAGQPDLAPYSASKAAVDKYTQDLACELKDANVLVNHVDPGWIRTDLGGPNAWEDVTSVIPGALVPALLPDGGPSGRFYAAQDYKGLWG